MRPTDEDQSGSRRPNLMSSTRRTASETNILAMLDRHSSGGPGRRLLRSLRRVPAMAWYGAAGVLVVGLVGSVAWLARDSGTPAPVDSTLAGAASPDAPVTASRSLSAPAAISADATAEVVSEADAALAEPPPATGATIVDLAPAEPSPPAQAAPVLRVLPPQEHAGRIVRHDPQRLAAVSKTPRTAGSKPPPATRTQAQAHADAHVRRGSAAAKQAPGADDTDVALISAIIQHAAKRQEAEEGARKP